MIKIDQLSLEVFLVFCRVGTCFMIVPGLASARVPVRIRLYLALVIALVIAPVVDLPGQRPKDLTLLRMVISECLSGLILGAVARLLIEAIEFFGGVISSYIGLSGISGVMEEGYPQSAIALLMTATAVLLLMLMDFPLHLVAILVRSYSELPLAMMPDPSAMLRNVTTTLSAGFIVGAQISAPFVVYAIIINAMFGILGRLVPQLPSYFVSVPFVALGGLALLLLVLGQLLLVLGGALSRLTVPQ
jgi:flagellar biosynthetic protein FliR